jgi:hypothetical protein
LLLLLKRHERSECHSFFSFAFGLLIIFKAFKCF